MFIRNGEVYLKKHHVQLLKKEPEYVKKRYHAVAGALYSKNNIVREKASRDLEISMRQFQRLIRRFQEEGIPGLHNKSKKPHRSPNQTPTWLEDLVVKVREETGFSSVNLCQIVNISLENQNKTERVIPRTTSRILVRRGVIESEKRTKKDWKRFEWGHPNQLIQADLTLSLIHI